MEESINSSVNCSFCSKLGPVSSEESGWTMYFEDFMASKEKGAAGVSSSSVVSESSVISDAASCVAWKPPSASIEVSQKYTMLSMKKRKGKVLLDDDSLQDTASSPVNSPKVTDLSYLTTKPGKRDDHIDTAQEDAVGSSNEQESKEIVDGFEFIERKNDCTKLKKRGLCLVLRLC